MAYNASQGPRELGDIKNEDDPDTQVDFSSDQIALKTAGVDRLTVTNTHVSCSVNHSASAYYGDGSNLDNVSASPAGADTQIQFNDGGSLGASANLTWDDTNLQVVGNISGSGTMQIGGNLTGSNIVPNTTLTYDLGSPNLEWSRLYVEEVIGDIEGAIRFNSINDEGASISRGQVVYIKGVSGQTPTVALAAADDATKMPAFGLAGSNAAQGASLQIVTFGSISNLNLSTLFPAETFAEGDPVFVQTGSGGVSGSLTTTRPKGSSNLIQNVGQVVRNGSGGDNQIKVGGAGRSNATPNLDKGYLFVGDDTNCSVQDNTVFISSSQNRVGINTITPNSTLEVNGTTTVSGNVNIATNANFFQGTSNTSTNVSLIGVNAANIVDVGNQGYDIHLKDDVTISGSLFVSGTTANVNFLNTTGVSGSFSGSFVGDGSGITGLPTAAITTYNFSGDNRVITSVNSTTVQGEVGLTYDGTALAVSGQVSASLGITGSALEIQNNAIISGSLRTKQIFTTYSAWNNTGTGIQFVPFYNVTDTSVPNHQTVLLKPLSGKLVAAVWRCQNSQGGNNVIFGIHTASAGVEAPGTGYNSETVTLTQNGAWQSVTFIPTGSQHFTAGQTVALSIDPNSSAGEQNMTCLWEYDVFGLGV